VTPDEIRNVVLHVLHGIAPEADAASIVPDLNLRDQVDLDSIDYLHFILGLDEALGVAVPEADYPQLATLDGCVAYLASRVTALKAT